MRVPRAVGCYDFLLYIHTPRHRAARTRLAAGYQKYVPVQLTHDTARCSDTCLCISYHTPHTAPPCPHAMHIMLRSPITAADISSSQRCLRILSRDRDTATAGEQVVRSLMYARSVLRRGACQIPWASWEADGGTTLAPKRAPHTVADVSTLSLVTGRDQYHSCRYCFGAHCVNRPQTD